VTDRTMHVGPLLHLGTTRGFERLTQRLLAVLAAEAEEVVVPRGESLMSPREPAQSVYVVVDGRVEVVEHGHRVVAGPGEAVGLLEVLAREAAGGEARAEVDTVALRLDGDILREAQERHFGILSGFLEEVASRLVRSPAATLAAVRGAEGQEPLGPQLDRVRRLLALHRSPAFPSASMDALAELADHMREVRLAPGEHLWTVGEPSTFFHVVCAGTIRYVGPGWSDAPLIGPGGVPGMPATLAGTTRTLEALATTDTTALVLGHEAFLDVLEDHFDMASGILARLAGVLLAPVAR
jgi:CRP-like cAMP-binding protein